MGNPKPPAELEVGDKIIPSHCEGEVFIITDIKPFIQPFSLDILAGETLDNQEVDDLKSPANKIYHIMGVELITPMDFGMRYNSRELIGPKANGSLNQRNASIGNPWPLDIYTNVTGPDVEITEQLGVNHTARMNFLGRSLAIKKTNLNPETATATKVKTD